MYNIHSSSFLLSAFDVSLFSELIDGYLLTRPHDAIVFLGDIVVLDCVTNTSRLLDWRSTRGGGIDNEWISRDNIIRPNISDSFRILSKEVGQFALVVNPVVMSLAGRYDCRDRDEEKPSSAEVTILSKQYSECLYNNLLLLLFLLLMMIMM